MAGALISIVMTAIAGIPLRAAAGDVVLYSTDFQTMQGNWSRVAASDAAGGQMLSSADLGWSSPDSALAAPTNYVEATFSVPSATPYHVWVRLRAGANSKYNDSVWAQFSDALDSNRNPVYPIGSTSGLLLNLENCSGCSLSGWGWQDKAYWLQQTNVIQFASSGSHTLRIQIREDGVQFDQVVLSPVTYLTSAPGPTSNDTTIVPRTTASGSTPYTAVPAAIPGQINAETFDNGGEGVAYHDTTAGNAGGVARATDVDIEASGDGGDDIGWIAAGEWLNYTVNVASAGSYSVALRVASLRGATMHLGFNGSSNVWTSVTIPATGAWQTWTTVTVPVTLGAGTQIMTLMFDTGGMNFHYAKVTAAATTSSGTLSPYSGTPMAVPGTIAAQLFDNGGEGVAYYDTTPGNSGGAFRNTDVDLEASSIGGYDIGWAAAGEWLNYTVNVASAGSYTAALRVASPNGGAMHVGFNGVASVWSAVAIPSTGGYQTWVVVNMPLTLAAGVQQMTVQFDSGGVNLHDVTISAASATPPVTTPVTAPSSGGTEISVAEWNIQVNDASAAHAQTVIDYLAALSPQPQVIVMEEAHKSQYATYISELLNRTGLVWTGAFQTHCPPGAWTGSSCSSSEDEGVGVFTSLPVVGSSTTFLPYADSYHSARGAVRLAISVNGETLQVFGLHLQVDNATARNNSMAYVKSWTSNFSQPQLVAGDFNADQDQIDTTTGMSPNFVDSWTLVGSGRGFTNPTPTPLYKLDYWFADAGGKATPLWSMVVTSTGTVSDHFPVQTVFTIHP
jgi:endonuclease/exonuclease/phosphatase family metal-dependent hydrolase